MRALVLLLAVCWMAGCASTAKPHPLSDGYGFGDGVLTIYYRLDQVKALQARYCAERDPLARRILLSSMHSLVPGYPVDGVCGAPDDTKTDGESTAYLSQLLLSAGAVLLYVL